MILLNPKKLTRKYAEERSARIMRETVAFFEAKGLKKVKEDDQNRVWYEDFLGFLKSEKVFGTLLAPPEYGGDGGPLGHLAELRVQRDPRLLRPLLLVHVAGEHPGPGPHLDERERGPQEEGGPDARRGRRLRLRPLREGARRRHLLHRHDAQAAGRRHLPGGGRQVLHRERQRGGHGLHLREGRGDGRVRVLRREPQAPQVRARAERHAQPVLRGRVRPARLPHHRGGHPLPRPGGLGRLPQHGERGQVQPGLGLHRHLHARPLRGHPPRQRAGASTTCASPTSRTSGRCSPTPTPASPP